MIETAMSRRTVLAGAAIAGKAVPASGALDAPERVGAATDGSADVIVIGAGLAGLSAARHLLARGASVIVLEARGRAGGRVHSQRLGGGQMIDLGAQFMGDAQTHVAALADEAGLRRISAAVPGDLLHLSSEDAAPQRGSPDALPLPMIDRLDALQALWRLERSVATLSRENLARLDRIDAATFLRDMTFLDPAYRAIGGYVEGEMCTPLAAVSAYEALEQGASIGGFAGEGASAQWFLADGAEGMTRYLADSVGGSLILNAPVSSVAQVAGAVTVTAATGTYRANRAIVAVPPQLYGPIGVLQELPRSWQAALGGWRLGYVFKTILVFQAPWWRRAGLSGTIVNPGGMFGAALDASPEDGLGILIVFSTAQGAQALGRLPDEKARVAAAMRWLRHAHGTGVPEPIEARSIDWSADPFSLGGYASRRGIGGWSAAQDLFAPCGRLHFAGTETANRWRSFMDGAVQSGLRAADDILGTELMPSTHRAD
jgi:monoamine oxidase